MTTNSKTLAYVAFAALGLIWGSSFVFMKWAAVLIAPTQIVLLRVLFGFVPVLLFALATGAMSKRHLRHAHHFLIMSVFASTLYYIGYAKGTALLPSSIAGMLSGSIPLFTFLAAWLFLREEPLNAKTIGGTALGFIGILLIAQPWNAGVSQVNFLGALYLLGGSLCVGAGFVYVRKFISPLGIPPAALAAYQLALALLTLLGTTDYTGMAAILTDNWALVGVVFGLGLCSTGIAFIIYYFITQELGAIVASSATYLPPIVALLIGALWVGEQIQFIDIVAMAAILIGVGILQSGRRAAKPKVPVPQS